MLILSPEYVMVSCLTHGHGVGGASLVGTMLEGGEGGNLVKENA